MSQQHDSQTGHYTSLPEVQEQHHEEEEEPPLLQEEEEDHHPLQELLCNPPPHANHLFSHIASNPGTPSWNLASTSNTTPTVLATNPLANQAPNLAQNPLAMPPALAGMDLTIWVNNQALIMSLIPTLQSIMSQNQAPPPRPPKEMDAQAPVKFSGDKTSKLWDFLFECGLVFDANHLPMPQTELASSMPYSTLLALPNATSGTISSKAIKPQESPCGLPLLKNLKLSLVTWIESNMLQRSLYPSE